MIFTGLELSEGSETIELDGLSGKVVEMNSHSPYPVINTDLCHAHFGLILMFSLMYKFIHCRFVMRDCVNDLIRR